MSENDAEPLVYELHDWEAQERVALGALLEGAGIVHTWDGADLLVPEGAEEQVDEMLDRIEFPDALEEAGDDGGAGEADYAVMSNLYVAADRLAGQEAVDLAGAGDLVDAAAAASAMPAPFGIAAAAWSQVQELAAGAVTALEAGGDDEIVNRDITSLRDLLRQMV